MAGALETAQLLDIQVDHVAGRLVGVAVHRARRVQIPGAAQPAPVQDAGNGASRNLTYLGNALAGPAQPAKPHDPLDQARGSRPRAAVRSTATIPQARAAFGLVPANPFADGFGADADFFSDRAATVPLAEHTLHQKLSTSRRVTGILVNVHGVSPSWLQAFHPSASLG